MTIAELIQHLPITLSRGSAATSISDLAEDSRLVSHGALFVARPGNVTDGRRYIDDALKAGAAAVLTDHDTDVSADVPTLRTHDVPIAAAHLAERIFGKPSRAMTLIGVTGTNGKTTVAHLVQQLFQAAGRQCGLIGTVATHDGAVSTPAALTTPGSIEISRTLRRMRDNGCDACVMEVSSHALQQGRVAALDMNIGVFTNLSGDHLDYHGTMDAYADAKARLFSMLDANGHAIMNADDPHWQTMVRQCRAAVHCCGIADAEAHWAVTIEEATRAGSRVEVRHGGRSIPAHIPLLGRHNVMNALQAIAVAHAAGLPIDRIVDALARCTAPPGRFERVGEPDGAITVLVDYAHTDDALDNALSALRPLVPDGARLHVVFGCGGDRDRTKRPRMAAAACRWADVVHITSDNPRTEQPSTILEHIIAGVPSTFQGKWFAEVDRAKAIHAAIHGAMPGDIVLIAGKGHEDYQIIGTTKRPFDDRQVADAALRSVREVAV